MGAVIIPARNVPRPPIDDPLNFWKFQSLSVGTPYMPVGGGFPFQPSFWTFKVDDAPWMFWKYLSGPSTPYLPVGGGYPFKPNFWGQKFGGDDSSVWTVKTFPTPPVERLVGGGFPFPPRFWQFGQDDSSVWTGTPKGPNSSLELASNLPPAKAHWTTGYDDGSVWTTRSNSLGPAFLPAAPASAIPMATNYVPNPPVDDFPMWHRIGLNPFLFPIVVAPPFIQGRWKLDYDDAAVWNAGPRTYIQQPGPLNMAPVYVPNPPVDDYSRWNGFPKNINAVPTPIVPARWKLDNDDKAVWYTKPGGIAINLTPPPPQLMATLYRPNPPIDNFSRESGFVNFNTLQLPTIYAAAGLRFNSDDVLPGWTGHPTNTNFALQAVVAGPFPTATAQRFRFNLDWYSTWDGHPLNTNFPLQAVVAGPLPVSRPPYGRWDYDQTSFWVGAPLNVSINITQPGPPTPSTAIEWILRARRRHNR